MERMNCCQNTALYERQKEIGVGNKSKQKECLRVISGEREREAIVRVITYEKLFTIVFFFPSISKHVANLLYKTLMSDLKPIKLLGFLSRPQSTTEQLIKGKKI